MTNHRILIVDDKETMLSLLRRILEKHQVVTAENGTQAAAILASDESFDLVVSDIRMPGLDGMGLLKEAKRKEPDLPVVLMTAFGAVSDAVQAMKAGAFDYIVKPFEPDELVMIVERALEMRRLQLQARRLQEELDRSRGFGPFVGSSEAIRKVWNLIEKAANAEAGVLLAGESGTGKELAARSIHEKSRRRNAPFVAVNCGALPEQLAESEFFGHIKGSFTGAVADKPGLFEEAKNGTLFLDEIATLPPPLQVKLLRAIEQREARRIGALRPYAFDLRIIAAANVDLKTEVGAGRFREDLYYRLHILTIRLPPLREHREDIPLLAAHFIRQFAGKKELASDALRALFAYSWPGNVRELRNAIESALAVSEGSMLAVGDLPDEITAASTTPVTVEDLTALSFEEACRLGRDRIARSYLIGLMKAFHGNVTASAERAGVERESLHRLLKRHSIDPASYRRSPAPGDTSEP